MKPLLVVTAATEGGAGVVLLCYPSVLVALLLGARLETSAAVTLGRVAAAALLALGTACWLARQDGRSRAATGLVAAMLLYDASVVAILAFAGIGLGLRGAALWPAVAFHAAMAIWCIACLVRGGTRGTERMPP